jgi:hypothetical protein
MALGKEQMMRIEVEQDLELLRGSQSQIGTFLTNPHKVSALTI